MRMTQNQMVLNHLKNIGSLTRNQAFELYGITELNTRICNLRSMGIKIDSTNRCEPNRFGKKVSFVEYSLAKEKAVNE